MGARRREKRRENEVAAFLARLFIETARSFAGPPPKRNKPTRRHT
jgi:hypothetical protein